MPDGRERWEMPESENPRCGCKSAMVCGKLLRGMLKLSKSQNRTGLDLLWKMLFAEGLRREVAEEQLRRIGQVMEGVELSGVPSWTADSVDLMRTELGPAVSRHYFVGSASIGGS